MLPLLGILTFAVALGVTLIVTPLVIRLATRLGAVDLPGGRKTHTAPMPRIGGVAVFAGFLSALAGAAAFSGNLFATPEVLVYWRGFAVAASGLFLVGLIDDLYDLSYRWKFAAQILAAVFVWWCGFRIEIVTHPLGGAWDLTFLSLPLTVLWIVAITNAVNLVDGLDGLAAGIALIATIGLAVISFERGLLGVTATSVALAGSLIGFLRFNFNPARIFLGDSGSLFLGFVLAVTAVRGSQKGPTVVAILTPLLVLGIPLMDTSFAVLRRTLQLGIHGRRRKQTLRYMVGNFQHVFMPDRGHIHHRLIDIGMSHRGAVLLLYGIAIAFVAAAFVLVLAKSLWIGMLLVTTLGFGMAAFLTLLYLRTRQSVPEDSTPSEPVPERSSGVATSGG